jgi:tetratricopeptide (TPR) repeat protein
MEIQEPRLRLLLRQADKIANAGKRAAAEQMYRQIIEENPDVAQAWFGLGQMVADPAEKEQALEKAVLLEPEYPEAARALAMLRGEPIPKWAREPEPEIEEVVEKVLVEEPQTAVSTSSSQAVFTPDDDEDQELFCYRHPDRSTALRCYNCGKPICMDCANKTPVGYICPDCIREKEAVFFNATTLDYLTGPLVCLLLSLPVGWLVARFATGRGFFLYIIVFFIGGVVGRFIGQFSKRAVGRRRGRYLPHLTVAMLILGTAVWLLLPIIFGAFNLFGLLGPGIFLFSAGGALFSYMK